MAESRPSSFIDRAINPDKMVSTRVSAEFAPQLAKQSQHLAEFRLELSKSRTRRRERKRRRREAREFGVAPLEAKPTEYVNRKPTKRRGPIAELARPFKSARFKLRPPERIAREPRRRKRQRSQTDTQTPVEFRQSSAPPTAESRFEHSTATRRRRRMKRIDLDANQTKYSELRACRTTPTLWRLLREQRCTANRAP